MRGIIDTRGFMNNGEVILGTIKALKKLINPNVVAANNDVFKSVVWQTIRTIAIVIAAILTSSPAENAVSIDIATIIKAAIIPNLAMVLLLLFIFTPIGFLKNIRCTNSPVFFNLCGCLYNIPPVKKKILKNLQCEFNYNKESAFLQLVNH